MAFNNLGYLSMIFCFMVEVKISVSFMKVLLVLNDKRPETRAATLFHETTASQIWRPICFQKGKCEYIDMDTFRQQWQKTYDCVVIITFYYN